MDVQHLVRGLDLDRRDTRRILSIALPAMVEMLMAQLFGMVDTIVLGHTGAQSKLAMAAIGYANSPINLMIGIVSAFNVGTTAAVAWSLGAGDALAARKATSTAMGANLILGLIAAFCGFVFAKPLVTYMGAREDAVHYSTQFLQVVSLGAVSVSINMAVTGALRGAGQTRLPMLYNLGGNLLNVGCNYVLVFGRLGFPAMGVLGSAISTTFSRTVATLAALIVLFFVDKRIGLRMRESFHMHRDQLKRLLRVGSTTAAEQLIMQLGFMQFGKIVNSLGESVAAAHLIGLNINGLSWVPSQAFGVAATALVGHNLGSGQPLKARDSAKLVHRLALCCSGMVAVLFLVGAPVIAGMYSDDMSVVLLAAGVVRIMALSMPGIATQLPIASALRGAGDTWFPLLASFIGIWCFRVPMSYLLIYTLGLGFPGAWLSIALDQTARAAVVYIRFSRGKWMSRRSLASVPDAPGEA